MVTHVGGSGNITMESSHGYMGACLFVTILLDPFSFYVYDDYDYEFLNKVNTVNYSLFQFTINLGKCVRFCVDFNDAATVGLVYVES